MESLIFGLELVIKALATVSCMYFLSLTTTMTDILSALSDLKVPLMIVTLMELMYRYIFLIFEQYDKIKIAQLSRMAGQKNRFKQSGQIFGVLLLRVLQKSDRIYEALASRGYAGEFKTLKTHYVLPPKFCICAVLVDVFLILIGIWSKL